eukprot:s948_g16.t1
MTCFSGCFSKWWGMAGDHVPARPKNSKSRSIAKILTVFSGLVEDKENHDDYRYLPLCQKEPRPIEKDPRKRTKKILQVMVRLNKATDDSPHSELEQASGLQMTPRRRPPMDGAAKDAKPQEEGLQTPVQRLSLASTTCPDLEDNFPDIDLDRADSNTSLLDLLHILAPCDEPMLGIAPFLGVLEFACCQTTCRTLFSTKGLVHHCERLLDLQRDDVLWARAEKCAMQARGCDKDECGRFLDNNPRTRGLHCIAVGVDSCFKADARSVLRVAACLRAFSSRAGQPAHARCLLSLCAVFTFGSASKSLRHLFAKDMLEVMKVGECVDRVFACKALQSIKSPVTLGRFNDKMVYQLVKLARNRVSKNYPVHPIVQDEAIDALMHLLPTDAATRYPYLVPQLELVLETADDITRVKAASLIDRLDDMVVTVSV